MSAGGCLILVVGPSGAGKDTLLKRARAILAGEPRFEFPRRYITRPAGDPHEDHIALNDAEFRTRLDAGAFSLTWGAHGLSYALPKSSHEHIADNRIVVANTSRTIIGHAETSFPRVSVIHVTASVETLAARLRDRAREASNDRKRRLERSSLQLPEGGEVLDLVNEGPLDRVAEEFVVALRSFAAGTPNLNRRSR